jgi:hypothetical protein
MITVEDSLCVLGFASRGGEKVVWGPRTNFLRRLFPIFSTISDTTSVLIANPIGCAAITN